MFQYQIDPARGCLHAALASVLAVPVDVLPEPDARCPWEPLSRWLGIRGKSLVYRAVEPVQVEGVPDGEHSEGAAVIGIVDAGRVTHAVVLDAATKTVLHDPAGEVEPTYTVAGLVTIDTSSSRARESCPWCQHEDTDKPELNY